MKKQYLLICVVFCLGISTLKAQYTDLLNFNGKNGEYPSGTWYSSGSLVLSGNVLYGMASAGGANNDGCIFSIHTNGSGYTDLFDFNGTNGSTPLGSLTLSGNILYGMTNAGAANGSGCIFSIDTNGKGYTDLHDFDTNAGGGTSLTLSGNVLYGITSQGNSVWSYINCCLFSIHTSGAEFKVLTYFNDSNQAGGGTLVLSGSVLYGTMDGAFANSEIFSIDTNGAGYKILDDTLASYTSLTLCGNILYGTVYNGGAYGGGYIFSINTNGNGCKDIYDFSSGGWPTATLTLAGSTLYGATRMGGTRNGGTVFSVDTNGSNFNVLHNFPLSKSEFPLPGELIIAGNVLYGMTYYGGVDTVGTIYSIKDTLTGISGITENIGTVKLFPNPNKGVFTIEVNNIEHEAKNMEVYNMLGEEVHNETFRQAQGDNTINLSNEPAGIYLYRIFAENGEYISGGKFVIQ